MEGGAESPDQHTMEELVSFLVVVAIGAYKLYEWHRKYKERREYQKGLEERQHERQAQSANDDQTDGNWTDAATDEPSYEYEQEAGTAWPLEMTEEPDWDAIEPEVAQEAIDDIENQTVALQDQLEQLQASPFRASPPSSAFSPVDDKMTEESYGGSTADFLRHHRRTAMKLQLILDKPKALQD